MQVTNSASSCAGAPVPDVGVHLDSGQAGTTDRYGRVVLRLRDGPAPAYVTLTSSKGEILVRAAQVSVSGHTTVTFPITAHCG